MESAVEIGAHDLFFANSSRCKAFHICVSSSWTRRARGKPASRRQISLPLFSVPPPFSVPCVLSRHVFLSVCLRASMANPPTFLCPVSPAFSPSPKGVQSI